MADTTTFRVILSPNTRGRSSVTVFHFLTDGDLFFRKKIHFETYIDCQFFDTLSLLFGMRLNILIFKAVHFNTLNIVFFSNLRKGGIPRNKSETHSNLTCVQPRHYRMMTTMLQKCCHNVAGFM